MTEWKRFPLSGRTGEDPQAGGFEGRKEWSIIECAQTLYRNKGTLAWIGGLGLALGVLLSLLQPRLYQAQASLEIQNLNENFLNLREIHPAIAGGGVSDAVFVQTQADLLQDYALIDKVVQRLRLDARPDFAGGSSGWDALLPWSAREESATVAAAEKVKANLSVEPLRGSRIVRIQYQASDPQLAAEIANAIAQTYIEQSIAGRQLAARVTHDSLSRQLDELRSRLSKSEILLTASARAPRAPLYVAIKREVDDTRKFYDALLQQVNDARLAIAVPQPTMRLVSPAQPPDRAFKPNWPLNLALGLLGGLLVGIALLTLREQSSSMLHVPGDAAMCLTVPELGAIPKAVRHNCGSDRRLLRWMQSQDGNDLGSQQLAGLSESFRATLASILSAGENGVPPNVLVVTSSRPGEGKTTVVSQLGIALAEISNKVLLIDGDMRRPRLHKVFDQSNGWGLSDLLREKNAVEDLPLDALVQKTSVPHLHLLSSGASPDNIFSLLCSGRLARLLPRFRTEFDYVLVDAPPCLEFADARIMARYVQQLLLVVQANSTNRRTAQAAVDRLVLDGIPVMGVILNRWDTARADGYGYSSYTSFGRDLA